MLEDLQYWFEDHPMVLPVIGVSVLILLVLGSLVWVVAGATNTPPVITNSSPTPTIENASPAIENNSPAVPSVEPDYYDYLAWKEHYQNKTEPGNPTTTPIMSGDPAMEHGVRIYNESATPTPTPVPAFDPMSENNVTDASIVETTQYPLDASMDSRVTGSLAWDAEHSTNLSYLHPGDHPVIMMRFVSNCNYDIHHERMVLQLDRQDLFGGWWTVKSITWNDSVTITKGKDLGYGEAPGTYMFYRNFTGVFDKGNIPDKWPIMGYNIDTTGLYRLQVWIYTPDSVGVESQACYISKQFRVLERR